MEPLSRNRCPDAFTESTQVLKDADPVGDSVVFDIENNEARLIS